MLYDPRAASEPSFRLERLHRTDDAHRLAELVRTGLATTPKYLDPVLFYDAQGSALFERICGLDAYYPTRTERALLERDAETIATYADDTVTVVELGSGSSEKTEVLLSALVGSGRRVRYVAIDISDAALRAAAARLVERFPSLEVRAIVGEYEDGMSRLDRYVIGQPLALFLGGNLGNFDPRAAVGFLARLREALDDDAMLLLGLDLIKPRARLERAYDDPEGVTARFNRNVLVRINRELGGHFDPEAFAHEARWNEARARVEMHLVSTGAQDVAIDGLEMRARFAAGESIHTESSYKYDRPRIEALARASGWRLGRHWMDDGALFCLNLLVPTVAKLA